MLTEVGILPELTNLLPVFARKPLTLGGGQPENKYVDMIYKTCSPEDTQEVPVGTVSKTYSLIQHRHIATELQSAIQGLGYSPDSMQFYLRMTEYGERMWLSGTFPDQDMQMDDGYPLKMQIHVVNSVDQSKRLTLELGWYREICSNGLMVMLHSEKMRVRHTANMNFERVLKWLNSIAPYMDTHGKRVQEWQGMEFCLHADREHLQKWIDLTVTDQWGRRNACRSYNIIKSARDCDIMRADLNSDDLATELTAMPGEPVLGQRPAETMYDVVNALTYVSSHQQSINTRLSYMSHVPDLVGSLEQRLAR